jgi:hypothetical protein
MKPGRRLAAQAAGGAEACSYLANICRLGGAASENERIAFSRTLTREPR